MTAKHQPNAGFTIVETLIVLGVAGLILTIVFAAIPTLERNGRNDQRKQDAATILEAVSRYALNNSANFPPDLNFLQYTKLSIYDKAASPAEIQLHGFTTGSAPATVDHAATLDTIEIYNYQRCDPAVRGGSKSQGADFRDVVALYGIETRTGTGWQCQQL